MGLREEFVEYLPHTIDCLIFVFVHADMNDAVGCGLVTHVMFALKQLCAFRADKKEHVFANTFKPLKAMMLKDEASGKDLWKREQSDKDSLERKYENAKYSPDFFSQALLFLQMLASE